VLNSLSACRAIGQEIDSLPGSAVVGFIKVSAKPLKNSLSTWASKWSYLFTHYLQVSCWVDVTAWLVANQHVLVYSKQLHAWQHARAPWRMPCLLDTSILTC
jgi:hypothetical protein